jgi:hypothetical protein
MEIEMAHDKPLLEIRARRYRKKHGFVEGTLFLTRNQLIFTADSKEYTKKILLREISDLSIHINPQIRPKPQPTTLAEIREIYWQRRWITFPVRKVHGILLKIKTKNRHGEKSTTWIMPYQDPKGTYNTIQDTLKRYK